MDRLNPLAIPLRPVTKTWVYTIVGLSVMTSMNLVSKTKLIFYPPRTLMEPWRLITSFCFFGGLEITLLQVLIIIARTNDSLEELYLYTIEYMPRDWVLALDEELKTKLGAKCERNKTFDFAYFMTRVALSIVATIVVLSRWYDLSRDFIILGPALQKVVLYILCRNSPTEQLDLMGINVMAKYMPFLTQFLEVIFSEEFRNFLKNIHIDVAKASVLFLTSTLMRQILLVFTIGHLWWFFQFNYLQHAHGEFSTSTQEKWSKAHMNYRTTLPKWLNLSEIFKYLLTPPWYFLIIQRLSKEQEYRERIAATEEAVEEIPTQNTGADEAQENVDEENLIEDISGIEGSSGIGLSETQASGLSSSVD